MPATNLGLPFGLSLPQQQPAVTASTPAPAAPAANPLANLSALLGSLGQKPAQPQPQHQPQPQPQHALPIPQPQPVASIPSIPNLAQFQPQPQPQQPPAPAPATDQNALLVQLLLANPALAQNPAVLAALIASAQQAQPQAAVNPWQQQQQQQLQQDRDPRDRSRYSPPPRSPPHRGFRGRSRSRSPPPNKRAGSPISFRRRSPVYGEYGREEQQGEERGGARRGGKNRFRRGSPKYDAPNRTNSPSVTQGTLPPGVPPPDAPKRLERDPTIGNDRIKVFSRTLFVGGVNNISESELRELFERFGRVQSCIVNHEKRHAFIKMYTRDDAVAAKEGMTTYRSGDLTLRTRWGVGFGPRDCSNYESGVSIVPIDRLTDADRRWVVSADYGGTGGVPLEGGMVIEEPDIEIGQGVSSKGKTLASFLSNPPLPTAQHS